MGHTIRLRPPPPHLPSAASGTRMTAYAMSGIKHPMGHQHAVRSHAAAANMAERLHRAAQQLGLEQRKANAMSAHANEFLKVLPTELVPAAAKSISMLVNEEETCAGDLSSEDFMFLCTITAAPSQGHGNDPNSKSKEFPVGMPEIVEAVTRRFCRDEFPQNENRLSLKTVSPLAAQEAPPLQATAFMKAVALKKADTEALMPVVELVAAEKHLSAAPPQHGGCASAT